MKTNFSLLFYLKKPKNYENGRVPIYLRITVNGQRAETTSGRECEPSLWNSIAGRFKGTKEEIKSLNAYLDNLQSQVYEAHRQLNDTQSVVTAETLKNKFLGKEEKGKMLIEVFKDHNKKVATLVGSEYAAGTYIRYKTSLKHTEDYLRWQYKVSDIDIRKLTMTS
jgi:hypothetical protein